MNRIHFLVWPWLFNFVFLKDLELWIVLDVENVSFCSPWLLELLVAWNWVRFIVHLNHRARFDCVRFSAIERCRLVQCECQFFSSIVQYIWHWTNVGSNPRHNKKSFLKGEKGGELCGRIKERGGRKQGGYKRLNILSPLCNVAYFGFSSSSFLLKYNGNNCTRTTTKFILNFFLLERASRKQRAATSSRTS